MKWNQLTKEKQAVRELTRLHNPFQYTGALDLDSPLAHPCLHFNKESDRYLYTFSKCFNLSTKNLISADE